MSDELYKKYRPKKFSEVVGQTDVIKSLVDMGKRSSLPHTILFCGPSGTGKTTLARILRTMLKCSDSDFTEINGADCRGIDTVREIRNEVMMSPLGGKFRIVLIDEAHQLTTNAQDALLKVLEDTPGHVYFFLCSTEPQKLKRTIQTRSTVMTLKPLTQEDVKTLVETVAEKEGAKLHDEAAEKIAAVVQGCAREALVILHSIIGLDPDEQLAAIEAADVKGQSIEIARALLSEKTTWEKMKGILNSVDDDPEKIRRMVLAYCSKVALGKGSPARSILVLDEFRDHWYDCGRAGLVSSCYHVVNG